MLPLLRAAGLAAAALLVLPPAAIAQSAGENTLRIFEPRLDAAAGNAPAGSAGHVCPPTAADVDRLLAGASAQATRAVGRHFEHAAYDTARSASYAGLQSLGDEVVQASALRDLRNRSIQSFTMRFGVRDQERFAALAAAAQPSWNGMKMLRETEPQVCLADRCDWKNALHKPVREGGRVGDLVRLQVVSSRAMTSLTCTYLEQPLR